jgi:hypothetical protein
LPVDVAVVVAVFSVVVRESDAVVLSASLLQATTPRLRAATRLKKGTFFMIQIFGFSP